MELLGVNLFDGYSASFEDSLFDEDRGVGAGAGGAVDGFLFAVCEPGGSDIGVD